MKKNIEIEIDMNSEKLIDAILSDKSLEDIKKLKENADLNYVYVNEYTPIIAAVMAENLQVLDYLVEKGADINQTNSYNQTALHFAFRYNKIKSATYLLNKQEVKKDVKDIYGTKPIDWAEYYDYKKLIKLYNSFKTKEEGLIK